MHFPLCTTKQEALINKFSFLNNFINFIVFLECYESLLSTNTACTDHFPTQMQATMIFPVLDYLTTYNVLLICTWITVGTHHAGKEGLYPEIPHSHSSKVAYHLDMISWQDKYFK